MTTKRSTAGTAVNGTGGIGAADLDAAVADLKQRLNLAQRARLRAEAERDAASAAASNARAQLAAEFGVDTVADAQAMLATLEQQLAEEIAALGDALNQMGV